MTNSVQARHRVERSPARHLTQIGPEIPDRVDLADAGSEAAVRYFVLTRAAEKAWSAINRNLVEQKGGFFWIAGSAGSGKTHFLNYVAALNTHAGQLDHAVGRELTIAFTVTDEISDVERALAIAVARAL